MVAKHDLCQDLPEFTDQLRHPDQDPRLKALLDRHAQLDRQTQELETIDSPTNVEQLNRLRRERVLAKDRIEQHLRFGR